MTGTGQKATTELSKQLKTVEKNVAATQKALANNQE